MEKQLETTKQLLSTTQAIMASGGQKQDLESGNFPTFQVSKQSAKLNAIQEWLKQNPDKVSWSNRKIAEVIGNVSHTLVGEAKRSLYL